MASELRYMCCERAVQVVAVHTRTAPVLDVRTIAKSSSPGSRRAGLLQHCARLTDAVLENITGLAGKVILVLTMISTSNGAYFPG